MALGKVQRPIACRALVEGVACTVVQVVNQVMVIQNGSSSGLDAGQWQTEKDWLSGQHVPSGTGEPLQR